MKIVFLLLGLALHLFVNSGLAVLPGLSQRHPLNELRIRIPKDKRPNSEAPLLNMTRDTLVYLLQLFIDPQMGELKTLVDLNSDKQDWALVPLSAVAPFTQPLFKDLAESQHYLDVFQTLKIFLKSDASIEARRIRHAKFSLPLHLSDLLRLLHYRQWPARILNQSQVKGMTRILYRSPKGYPILSVAETHESTTGDPSSPVRETEIILEREDQSGNFDFYAYDSDGLLTDTSLFHNNHGGNTLGYVPHTCVTCHYDGANRVFQQRPLSFHAESFNELNPLPRISTLFRKSR